MSDGFARSDAHRLLRALCWLWSRARALAATPTWIDASERRHKTNGLPTAALATSSLRSVAGLFVCVRRRRRRCRAHLWARTHLSTGAHRRCAAQRLRRLRRKTEASLSVSISSLSLFLSLARSQLNGCARTNSDWTRRARCARSSRARSLARTNKTNSAIDRRSHR